MRNFTYVEIRTVVFIIAFLSGFMGRRNEYQPKGGDALWLGSKGRYGSCVGGR